MREQEALLYCRQLADHRMFLSDEMARKYGFSRDDLPDWTRNSDLSGWVSPFINPWTVVHEAAATITTFTGKL